MMRNTTVGLLAAIVLLASWASPTVSFADETARFSIKAAEAPEGGPAARKRKTKGARRAPPFLVKVLVDEATMHARQASLSLLTIASANRIAMHKHPGAEVLYIKKGRARVVGPPGVSPEVLPSGTAILIPGGMPHAIENMVRTAPVEILQVFAPAGPERVYRDPLDTVGRSAFEVIRDPRKAIVPDGAHFAVESFEKAPVYPQPGMKIKVHLLFEPATSDSAAVSMAVVEFEPKAELPLHAHKGSAAILYVLSGAGEIQIGDDKVKFGPDQAIHLPENQPHAARFTGPERTIALLVYAPAGPEQRWKLDAPTSAATNDGPHRTGTPATTVPHK